MNLLPQDRILLEQAYEKVLIKEERNITSDQAYNNFVLVLGIPGAGKSTLYKYGLINLDNIVHVSPDKWIEIHAKQKQINLGSPAETAKVHQQISPTWKKHSQQFIANKSNRVNYVMEKIGGNPESTKKIIDQVKELGFKIIVVLVHVNLDTAIKANQQRPRTVPENLIKDAYERIESTFDYLVGQPEVSEAWRIDNDQHPSYQGFRSSNFIKKIK